jgi:hypothetical protein
MSETSNIWAKRTYRRILKKYAAYYNELRTHRSLGKDAPIHRAIQPVGTSVARSASESFSRPFNWAFKM